MSSDAFSPLVCFSSFTAPNLLPSPGTTPRYLRSFCVFANAKRSSNQKRASRPSKSKRVSTKNTQPTEANTSTSKKPVGFAKSIEEEVVTEETSGEAGDETPHRAMTKPSFKQMENPEDDPLDAPTEPLIELSQPTKERIQKLRFDPKSKPDEVIEYLADARKRDDFADVIVANRDFVTENVLYRFTSAILQVESRDYDLETREEEARNMRQLRKDIIAHCWSLDFPLKVGVQLAEARLLNVLKGGNIKSDVGRYCGNSAIEVDSFWIVVFAAVAAWEERGRENPELVNVDMQKSLKLAADACKSLKVVNDYLSPSLKAVQEILTSTDPDVQRKVVATFDDENIAELCSFTEKIRLLPTPAYGALVRRLRSIRDYVRAEKYGIKAPELEPFRFTPPEIRRESKLATLYESKRSL
ncbi:hypothetical protein FGB62_13g023 [Gracilaria domingensis]|nr:hypothetical protein FGB62_13g023 [Gracilaria domingensis]